MVATRAPEVPELDSEAAKVRFAAVNAEIKKRGLNVETGQIENHPLAHGPQTKEALHRAIFELTGYSVPRVAVCENHAAPMDIFWELYTEEVTDMLVIGNRGGGKTTISGFLHGAKGKWKPGYKTAIAGAIDKQSDRAYKEFKRFIDKCAGEIVDTLQKETTWVNGSATEVLAGTVRAVNGPHPHLAQFDELELVQSYDVFEEWQNMSQGTPEYAGQNLLTSTRKRPYGLVQQLVKEAEDAIKEGNTPPWEVRTFCIFETLANRPDCSEKNEDGSLKCGCDKVVKGEIPDGAGGMKPRTFADVCRGRAKRADGFVQLRDAHRRFRSLGQRTWEAQQECLRPSTEGLVHTWWDPEIRGVPVWYPRPEYGPVYRSWDWGGTNPHSVHFQQVLKHPVKLLVPSRYTQQGETREMFLREGDIITFDEIFHDGGGFTALGTEVFERTQQWHQYGFNFDVEMDFCDPAGGPAPKDDVKKAAEAMNWPAPKWRSVPVGIEESLEKHIEWGEDGRLYVVPGMCPNLVEEYEIYHWPERKGGQPPANKPVLVDDHAVDDQRYFVWNYYILSKNTRGQEQPGSEYQSTGGSGAIGADATRQRDVERTYGSEMPSSSLQAPDYLGQRPERNEPTVRRWEVPGIRGH